MATFIGTSGDDTLTAIPGNDTYQLGAGNDTIYYNATIDALGVLSWNNGFDTIISTDGGVVAPNYDKVVLNFSSDYIFARKVGADLQLSVYAHVLNQTGNNIDPGSVDEVGRITLQNAFTASIGDRISSVEGPLGSSGFGFRAIPVPVADSYGHTAIYGFRNPGTGNIVYNETYWDINFNWTEHVQVYTDGTALVQYSDSDANLPWAYIYLTYSNYGTANQALVHSETYNDNGTVDLYVMGTSGNDTILGGTGNDTLDGGAGSDSISGLAGNDVLLGGAGADTLIGGAGNDTIDGGAVLDHINYNDNNFVSYNSATAGVVIDLSGITGNGSTGSGTATGDASVGSDVLMNVSFIQGSSFNDVITGSSALIFEQIEGGAGNDTLNGGAITDTLNGENFNRVTYQNATGAGVTVDLLTGTAVGAAGSNVGNDTLLNFNQVRGSGFNDTLLGSDRTDVNEQFDGRGGNDFIDGRGGFDFIRFNSANGGVTANLVTGTSTGAGVGTDTFVNIEGIHGSSFSDLLIGGNPANGVTIGDGLSEVFRGEGGSDTIDGGQGYDRVDYTSSTSGVIVVLNDTLDGSASDGLGGTDVLRNIEGVRGSAFNDVLTGSNTAAFESFEGREGNDTIDGLGGIDRVDYQNSIAGVTVNLTTGIASDGYGGTDTLFNIENVRGSGDFNDSITGSAADNRLEGLGGNDNLLGSTGNDTLFGGDGNDFLYGALNGSGVSVVADGADELHGGAGADTLRGNAGNDQLFGDAGDDNLRGDAGDDLIDGGDGWDFASYRFDEPGALPLGTLGVNFDASIVGTANEVQFADGLGGIDTLRNIEAIGIQGTAYNDTLTGSQFGDQIFGGAGNDIINGGAGDDFNLSGNAGNDSITGGAGNDSLQGGAGDDMLDGGVDSDTVYYDDALGGVTVNLDLGTATGAGIGTDSLISIESASGSFYADTLTGSAADNRLEGLDGNDTLIGGAGNDTLDGGTGKDVAVFSGNYSDYSVVFDSVANQYTVTDSVAGRDGVDTLSSIEFVRFADSSLLKVDPAGTYLATSANDPAVPPGTIILSDIGIHAGDMITLSRTGAFQAGTFGFTDSNTSMLAVFSGASGMIAPEVFLGFVSLPQATTQINTDISQDFFVVGAGVTTVKVPVGATSIFFSPNDSFFSDNTDPNGDYGVIVRLLNSATSYAGTDLIFGTSGDDSLVAGLGNDTLYGGAGNDTLLGQEGTDTLIGGAGNDSIDGGAIVDRINYNDLNFTSYGSATAGVVINLAGITGDGSTGSGTVTGDASVGTDTLINVDFIQGSNFNDTITGSSALIFEQIEGGAGNDVLDGGAITDTLNGDNSNRVSYQNATGAGVTVDLLAGTAVGAVSSNVGSDTLVNFNQVRGSSFDDTLLGSDRTDLTESFEGRGGNDYIDGRGGFDIVRYNNATAGITANLATGTATGAGVGTDTLVNIEGVFGSSFNDILTGGSAANGVTINDGLSEVFRGEAGNDTIDGGQGYDRVDYTSSTSGVVVVLNDTLDGSASDGLGGTDVLRNIEGVRGSDFNDVLTGSNTAAFESFEGREGNDTIDGLGGIDRVDYQNSIAGVTVNLTTGIASDGYGGTDTLSNIENVRGSRDFNDVITGSSGNNYLQGLGGNDTLDGGLGADSMLGGDGSDSYYVDNSNDVVTETNADLNTGGADLVYSTISYSLGSNLEYLVLIGTDTITGVGNSADNYIEGNAAANFLDGGLGADTMKGGDGNDTYYVDSIFDVVLETNANQLTGGTDNVVSTVSYTLGANLENILLAGSDAITGVGNELNNYIEGNAAVNYLEGGLGSDRLMGGLGADTFVFKTVGDSQVGSNRDVIIDFSSVQGDRIDLSGMDANSTLANDQAFSFIGSAAFSAAGQLRLQGDILSGDINGDGIADFELQLLGVSALGVGELVL
jgi:Ca2+-binding RTX toxin-like protein